MCGICGLIAFGQKPVTPDQLKTLTDKITHRGPDDEGFWISGNKVAGLGFRRLSIIDLSTGSQPHHNEDKSIWSICNGEIYNFLELRKLLTKKGHTFHTNTDVETVVHLYEEYGENCVDHLRGMFAFAIWDERKQRLFAARDRFGIKPFYYAKTSSELVYGSELSSLAAHPGLDLSIDHPALEMYLSLGYVPHPYTIYQGIRKLSPGCCLSWSADNPDKVDTRRYWRPMMNPDYGKTEEQWLELLDEELHNTVKMHMASDVPLGAFLSGGLDSSCVVYYLSKLASQAIKTFSIGFTEEKFNELPYAKIVSQALNTEHHELVVNPDSIDLITDLAGYYGEPYADASALPTYLVSKLARTKVTVALSGDGGDELFAGYNSYATYARLNKHSVYPALTKYLARGAALVLPEYVPGSSRLHHLAAGLHNYGVAGGVWPEYAKCKLWRREYGYLPQNDAKVNLFKNTANHLTGIDAVSRLQEMDMEYYLPGDILTKVDIASMRNSLEARVPLLDHIFAELTFKIPVEMKLKGFTGKYIFKKLLSKKLPAGIMNRPKSGFAIPLAQWMRGYLSEDNLVRLNDQNNPLYQFFDREYLLKVVKWHKQGKRNYGPRLWNMFILEKWLSTQYHKK